MTPVGRERNDCFVTQNLVKFSSHRGRFPKHMYLKANDRMSAMETLTKVEKNGVTFFVCEPLEKAGFVTAFSTRDLILTYKQGPKDQVDENRGRFLKAVGAENFRFGTVQQTHSNVVHSLKSPLPSEEPSADALASDEKNVFLAVKTADCLPVLIADPVTGVMAAVHAGWRGTQSIITERTVANLRDRFGVRPETCLVSLGPSACADCYEVGDEVARQFSNQFIKRKGPKWHLDVPAANRDQLLRGGIRPENIYSTSFCTMHHNDLFFSHRKESHKGAATVGRLLGAIGKR